MVPLDSSTYKYIHFYPHLLLSELSEWNVMRTNGAVFWRQYIFWHDSGTRIDSGAVYLFMSPGAILARWRCWQAWRQTRQLENIFLMRRVLSVRIMETAYSFGNGMLKAAEMRPSPLL
jgi:hypothetical protein